MINEEEIYNEFEKALVEAISIYEVIGNKNYPAINIFIRDKVWESLVKYNRMEQTTKEKFFENLYKGTPTSEYAKGLRELWNVDHSYMDNAIEELQKMVIQRDFKNAEMYGHKKLTIRSIKLENYWMEYQLVDKDLYELHPDRDFKTLEERYVNRHIKLYRTIKERFKNSKSRERELAEFVEKYEKLDKTIPYYAHQDIWRNGKLICEAGDILHYVDVSTYLNMLYNVNLTRSAWNRATYDAKLLGNHL